MTHNTTKPEKTRYGALIRILAASIAVMVSCSSAVAHGSLSMEKDICKLTIGNYQMHFAGYQPQLARAEFCEDIPSIGATAIVLDFVQPQLRGIPVEVKILRKADGSEDQVVFERTSQVYPNGTISIRHTFTEPGAYVGIVSVATADVLPGIFPFSVGQSNWSWLTMALSGFAVAIVIFVAWRWSATKLPSHASGA